MKQYLDLLNRVLTEGTEKVTAPEQVQSVYSDIRCASIWRKDSRA